ncbi:MAG: protein-L-isoaspartate(D-aspartate) O-methyltransferase [Spirochaetota bacterium]|nr:protein-L-isoaspartate(D-aspartate) O-methyltransferase [Spirochaetota bacterium]
MYHREIDNSSLARKGMVNEIHKRYGIYSKRVLDAMEGVPRHLFISEALRYRAYDNISLPIGFNQTTSKPSTIAKMVQALNLMGDERILEIGTGSGYQSAVLAEIATHVITLERIKELSKRARDVLIFKLGYRNIDLIHGENFLKLNDLFDGIIVSAGAISIPFELFDKLKINGVLVIPIERDGEHRIFRYIKRSEDSIIEDDLGDALFVPLITNDSVHIQKKR